MGFKVFTLFTQRKEDENVPQWCCDVDLFLSVEHKSRKMETVLLKSQTRELIEVVCWLSLQVWLTLADQYLHSISIDWEKTLRFAFNERSNPDDDSLGIQIVKVSRRLLLIQDGPLNVSESD